MIHFLLFLDIWIYQITLEFLSLFRDAFLRQYVVLAHPNTHLQSWYAQDWNLDGVAVLAHREIQTRRGV